MRHRAATFIPSSLVVFGIVASLGVRVEAWEADVHYALTYLLATKAGFTDTDARTIADGALSPDVGTFWPAILGVVHAVVFADAGAARSVQDFHFPTDITAPSDPKNRVVVPDGIFARQMLAGALSTNGRSLLTRVGQALQPLQDSWSHQDQPDSPPRPAPPIRPEYSWSHAVSRGGWLRHRADLTPAYPGDAMATAAATYEVLRQLHQRLHGTRGPDFSTFASDINDFTKAPTKEAKRAWFGGQLKNSPANLPRINRELDTINLPGDGSLWAGVKAVGVFGTIAVTADVVVKAQQMLDEWLRDHSFKQAVSHISLTSLGGQFGAGAAAAKVDAGSWCERFLVSWLIPDHSVVERNGHLDPADPNYEKLPLADAAPPLAPTVRITLQPNHFIPLDPERFGGATAGLLLTFGHAPRDAVMLAFGPDGTVRRMLAFVL